MADSDWHSPTKLMTVIAIAVCYTLWQSLKVLRIALQKDLRKIPGPLLSTISYWPLKLAVLSGRRSLYIHALHQRYGPFVRISPNEVAIAELAAYKRIHRVGSDFRKNPGFYQRLSPRQYNDDTSSVFGIVDPHKASARRKLYQPVSTKKSVAEWEPQILRIVDSTVQKIKRDLEAEKKCDVMKWWMFMASDVLGEIAFGQSFGNIGREEKSRMLQDIESTLPLLGIRLDIPWLYDLLVLLRLPQTTELTKIYERLAQYSCIAVENARHASKSFSKTLFSRMVPEGGSQELSDDVIENEATNALFAGTDTVSMTLTYLVYAVLREDGIKHRLVQEVQDAPRHPTWNQLEGMAYLNNVLEETLRKYPPIPGSLTRIVPQVGASFDKFFLPGDTLVSTQAYTFHHDPKVFDDPFSFKPDRWLHATSTMKEHIMAFGGPARSCLGQNIARLEILHAVFEFFRECGDTKLAGNMTEDSMSMVDYFAIKPKGGVCFVEPT